jgi:phosphoenolpyruvate carboxykinase (ATP)
MACCPPIAKLTPEQAMYHFLSGYTARVAGTEIGVTEPKRPSRPASARPSCRATRRSTAICSRSGSPRAGSIAGWSTPAGAAARRRCHGIKRMPIKVTRALLNAALDGSLKGAEFRKDPNFGFMVPVAAGDIDPNMLDPRAAWDNKAEYDATAGKLVDEFVANFAQFADHVDEGVRQAAPQSRATETA